MNGFRNLTTDELRFIDRLLEAEFPGKEALRQQKRHALARTLDEGVDNYGSIEFLVENSPLADVKLTVPVEGIAYDSDGVPICVLLHVKDGKLKELEFYKADGKPILKFPPTEEFVVRIKT